MADCIGTGFPRFPSVLLRMRYSIGENGCSHILKCEEGRGALTGRKGKKGKREKRRKGGKGGGGGK